MHRLLQRQIRTHLGGSIPSEMADFVRAVEAAYVQHDEDRALLQRSMDQSAGELIEANDTLRARAREYDQALRTLQGAVETLGLQESLHLGPSASVSGDDTTSVADRLDTLIAIADLLAEQAHLRNEMEQQLRSRKARLRMLMQTASDAILVIDAATGYILDANDAAQSLTGYSIPELTQMHHVQLHPEAYHEAYRAGLLDMLDSPGHRSGEAVLLHRQGHQIPIDVTSTVTKVDGQPLVQGILRDATDRQRHEAALVEARDAAESANRLKSAFLANMSHELRTPLTAIIGFADVIEEALLDIDQDELASFADLIRQGGQRLLDTLNSVLEFARLEAGRLPLTPRRFDLRDRIQAAVDFFRTQAEKKGVRLRLDPSAAPSPVSHDPHAIDRILTNLISNGIKFTEDGEINVSVAPMGDRVRITVTDTGIGMSPDFLQRLFEEFVQESPEVTRKQEGSGLGLAITKRLVELMDGTVEVDSRLGHGTRFTLDLPQQYRGESLPSVVLESPPRTLVLADAEPTTETLLRHLLPPDYVLAAVPPSAVLDVLDEAPDVLFYAPPHPDAVSPILDAMHRLPSRPRTVLLTDDAPDQTSRYLALGFDAVLHRPFTRAHVLAVLQPSN